MEQAVAKGYAAIKKQATARGVVTPNLYVPYYNQSLTTDIHLIKDTPVYGQLFKTFQNLRGIRSHGGALTYMGEPNSIASFLDMLATKTSTSGGSDPYTHVFGSSNATDPNYYTLDISIGSYMVLRFFGVKSNKLTFGWDSQKMQPSSDLAALGAFSGREIASIDTVNVTLKTDYDTNATEGLVASDLVYVVKADGTARLSTTVASITDGDTVVLGASAASYAAGDMLVLRPATPSLDLLQPFLWPTTEFRFADTAANALSAAQTRLDEGTEIALLHNFNNDEGEPRSGGRDPAALIHTQYDYEANVKKAFTLPDEIRYWNSMEKRALVMRSFNDASHELRVTLNHLASATNEMPSESDSVWYYEIGYSGQYNQSDGQGFAATVLNNRATI